MAKTATPAALATVKSARNAAVDSIPPLPPTSDAVGLSELKMLVNGLPYLLGPSIEGDPQVDATKSSAETITMTVRDVNDTLGKILADENLLLAGSVTITRNGIVFALDSFEADDTGLVTLTWVDQVQWRLEQFSSSLSVKRSQATRAEFVALMVDEASAPPLEPMNLFCPEIDDKERIASGGKSTSDGTSSGTGGHGVAQPPATSMPLPSGDYGPTRAASAITLIVLHDSEIAGGADYFAALISSLNTGARLGTNSVWDPAGTGLSVQIGVNTDGSAVRLIPDLATPFGAVIANPISLQIEQAGFESQTSWPDAQIRTTAKQVAYWSARYGIPLTLSTTNGVCQHKDLGAAGGGHTDCGPDYPFDKVLSLAKSFRDA